MKDCFLHQQTCTLEEACFVSEEYYRHSHDILAVALLCAKIVILGVTFEWQIYPHPSCLLEFSYFIRTNKNH